MSNKTTLFDGCQGQFCKVTGIGEDCRVARCLSDSWSGASGSWNTPPFQPSPAGLGAACLLYLTSQPKAGGRYGSEGEPVRRKEAKKRREVITSSHWVLKIPPRFITGALHWRQNVGHLERKEQECFGGIWHLQIPALAREARLRSPHPLLFGRATEELCRSRLIAWLAYYLHFFICTASRFTSLAFQDRGPTLLLFVHSYLIFFFFFFKHSR